MDKTITIIGAGPGNIEYLPQIAIENINKADVLIGGARHLEHFYHLNCDFIKITADLKAIVEYIKINKGKKIVILVSGDTGFYSLLPFLKKHFEKEALNVIPGISSVQLAFAKIADVWQDAVLTSVHGKSLSVLEKLLDKPKVGLLTDTVNSPQEIAKFYCQHGFSDKLFYICSNLSYSEEEIIRKTATDVANDRNKYKNCVVVITNE